MTRKSEREREIRNKLKKGQKHILKYGDRERERKKQRERLEKNENN